MTSTWWIWTHAQQGRVFALRLEATFSTAEGYSAMFFMQPYQYCSPMFLMWLYHNPHKNLSSNIRGSILDTPTQAPDHTAQRSQTPRAGFWCLQIGLGSLARSELNSACSSGLSGQREREQLASYGHHGGFSRNHPRLGTGILHFTQDRQGFFSECMQAVWFKSKSFECLRFPTPEWTECPNLLLSRSVIALILF